jgi:hypothetical protein
MIIVLSVLLLIMAVILIWCWDEYVRIIPLSGHRLTQFNVAAGYENPLWIQQVKHRGGMTRREWADFLSRNFSPPPRTQDQ